MKRNKLINLLLAFALCGTVVLSGCGTTGDAKDGSTKSGIDGSSGGGNAENGEIPQPDPDTRYEITYTGYWSDSTYEDGSYCETLLENVLGADITVIKQEGNDAINVMLASDEMPDCGTFSTKQPAWMYQQELVRPIPRAMVEHYCPSLIAYYDQYPLLYEQTLNPDDPDEFLYLVGVTFQFVDYYLNCDFYRYDWIQNLGIDLGVNVEQIADRLYVADDGIELSKFIEIMTAFVKNDPDGNGQNDTVGITGQNLTHHQFFSAFGFHANTNNVNGRAEMCYVMDEYKEYLKSFAQFYDQGLVDPDIIQNNRQLMWDKVNSGNAGYFIVSTNALQASWALDRPPLQLFEADPNATVLCTPGIKPDGGTVQSFVNASPAYENFFVNAKVTDDRKLAKILQFVEAAWFGNGDKDLHASLLYGEKGVDWEWNEDETQPIILNSLANGEKGTWTFAQLGQDKEVTVWIANDPLFNAGDKYWTGSANGSWLPYQHAPYKQDIGGSTDYELINTEVGSDIDAYVGSYRTQAFLGQIDVDETWYDYLAELDRLGYNKMMDELEKLDPLEDVIASYQ